MTHPIHEIIEARGKRKVATLRLMAQIAFGVNLVFLLLALGGQVWLRVLLLSTAQIGFALSIFLANPARQTEATSWLYLASCWVAIMNGIYTNGAPTNHIILAWLAVLICIAGLIGSQRCMSIIATVSGLSLGSVWACHILGIAVPNLTPESQLAALAVLHGFSLMIFMAMLVVGYQRKLTHYETQVDDILTRLNTEISQREAAENAVTQTLHEKQQLMRNLSHEFRTPLNSIIGFSERMLKRSDSDQWRRPLETVARNGHALHRLVGESLLLDAIEATPLEVQRVDVGQIVQNIIDAQTLLASEHEIELSYTPPSDSANTYSDVDIARLAQAITNVLLFCIRQTAKNSEAIRIQLGVDQSKGLNLELTYGGIALAPEAHKQLFETHYEHVLNNDKDLPISAFALKIASLIIKRHRGQCFSHSEPDSGSNQITLSLPPSELG